MAPLAGLLVVQRLLFPAPLGVVLNGALVGGRIALIALGIALVYRANRVVNFAQGDLGALPATLGVMLIASGGLSYWLGLLAGLAAAVVLGVLVETLVVRRFFTAPRLVLTVATIGVAQLLTGAALVLPRAFGDDNQLATRIAPPFSLRFEVDGTVFSANDIFTMIVVPLAFLGLTLFLRASALGSAVVAAAERADRAATLGIPVRRLHTIVWVIASVLAFLAMFLRAGAVGLPIGQVLAPTFLVQALAAAVFGRFERLTTIAVTAVGLGIVDQAMTFQDGSRPAYNDAVLFVIVLAGLLLMRRRGSERVDRDSSSTWQATREVRPVPRELARLPEVRAARWGLWAAIAVVVLTLPLWLSPDRLDLATVIVLFGIVAASLVVLTGWAGQVSLGHMAFVGVGAALGGAMTDHLGWDLWFAVLGAGLVGSLAAVVVGYPALRRGGLTLAVSTLAFALLLSSYGLDRSVFGDQLPGRHIDRGLLLTIDLTSETRFFYVSLAFLALALAMVVGVRRSRTGRVLVAIRENERAARSYGIAASRTTLAAFALSGFLAAVAGTLFVHQQQGLSPDPYVAQRSLDLFSMVVIGGLGSLPGALLGAVYVRGADFFLPVEWQFLATGVGLLAVLLVFPSGLGGVLADLRDGALRWVARRRGLVVPSLMADPAMAGPAMAGPAMADPASADGSVDVIGALGQDTGLVEAPAVAATPADASPGGSEVIPATAPPGRDSLGDREATDADVAAVTAALSRAALDVASSDAESLDATSPGARSAESDGDAPAGGAWARWVRRTTGGAALYPLAVLFGLNMADELDRTAFGVLAPEIRDQFGLDTSEILTVVALSYVAALVLALPVGFVADRWSRVRLGATGAAMWGVFSVLTGLAPMLWLLVVARAGSGLGRTVNEPVHNSLLADYYDIPTRPRIYAVHRYANAIGQFLGPFSAGMLAYAFGWRVPFLVFAIPTAVLVVLALRLREPVRGHFERRAMGASDSVVETEEQAPSYAESWRIVWQVRTLRRVFVALPFLAVSVIGLLTLGSLFYQEVFDLDERARGFLAAAVEPAQLVGLVLGIPLATKLMARDAGLVLRFLGVASGIAAAAWVVFALAPNLVVAVAANAVISASLAVIAPGAFAALSLAVPPKVRSFGYAVAALFVVPGFALLPIVGTLADAHGIRTGLLVVSPVFVVGGLVLASSGKHVTRDIAQVWKAAAARSEVALLRRQGQVKLLVARGVDVHYDNLQVLFDVDLEVAEGEVVALLGTNGAGKSTLLRAVSGLVQASGGAVVFDGRDITHTPPEEIAGRGVAQAPGGQGVFTQLSVADNLSLAGWSRRRSDRAGVRAATGEVLRMFPALRARLSEPAGNLSGGQQQMLTLGMAFVAKPRLLLIDELSLGLAPVVVAELLEMVRELRRQGVTIVLVEQSVNVALHVADRAYFLEKGEVRFEGPTADLLDRPDLLRSVFLATGVAQGQVPGGNGEAPVTPEVPVVLEVRHVTRRFGGVRALDDVSFDVGPGEIVGFVGPNGAGKTTLFDVVSGFTPADQGTIRVAARDGRLHELQGVAPQVRSWRGLGRSFQDGRLFPGLTVAEALAVALEQHVDVRDPVAAALHFPSVVDSEAAVAWRVDELIELLGLGAMRDKFVRELSTGTRRVVDLACVCAQGPSVILLDEPSSGIAQREAEALAPLLRRVCDELAASLLVVEHDLPLLVSISDRMIALELGRVVVEGTPQEVTEHPAVVASYLGTDDTAIARSDVPTAAGTPDAPVAHAQPGGSPEGGDHVAVERRQAPD